jgi:hypothetical protein
VRFVTPLHLALSAAALLLGACSDTDASFEPSATAESPADTEPLAATAAAGHWTSAYAFADRPTASSYSPSSTLSYNRSGQRITITRPAGTTGRYVVTFTGLSAVIGAKSTVHLTGALGDRGYCTPMTGTLVSDKVEVRCFAIGSGSPVNASFHIAVLGKGPHAFAFANQPTATGYAPAAAGTWNVGGSTKVIHVSTGTYSVVFNNLGVYLNGRGGHVQVVAVGATKAYCKAFEGWGGSPNLSVGVQCYSASGTLVDAKFTVLFQLPEAGVAYAYAGLPTFTSYEVSPVWGWNPGTTSVGVTRLSTGTYEVRWPGSSTKSGSYPTVHVTAITADLFDNAQCKAGAGSDYARVECFAANGVRVDAPFTALLGW